MKLNKFRLNLFPKPIKWEDVRDEILLAIEEEERGDSRLVIPSTAPPDYPNVGQIEERDTLDRGIGGRVFVTVDASEVNIRS